MKRRKHTQHKPGVTTGGVPIFFLLIVPQLSARALGMRASPTKYRALTRAYTVQASIRILSVFFSHTTSSRVPPLVFFLIAPLFPDQVFFFSPQFHFYPCHFACSFVFLSRESIHGRARLRRKSRHEERHLSHQKKKKNAKPKGVIKRVSRKQLLQ